jgi:hypothetical protein
MAETILAGEKIEKFSLQQRFTLLTSIHAVVPWLSEYFFVRHRPRHAGNRDGQQKEPSGL